MIKGNTLLWRWEMSERNDKEPKEQEKHALGEENLPKKRERKKDKDGNDIKIKRKGLRKVKISEYQSKSGSPSDEPHLQIEAMAKIIDKRLREFGDSKTPIEKIQFDSLEKLSKRMEKFRIITGEEGYEDMEIEQPTKNQLMYFQDKFMELTLPKLEPIKQNDDWLLEDIDDKQEHPIEQKVGSLPQLATTLSFKKSP